jgi:hypothetical protein
VDNKAQSGDIVDLSQLPSLCGMRDSVITLGTEISVTQNDLSLKGPSPHDGTVTLSGAHTSRVLHHTGTGTLYLKELNTIDGYAHAVGDVSGGCIFSESGGVYLRTVVVDHCMAVSDSGHAYGGGVRGSDVTLVYSTISANTVTSQLSPAGGGVYAYGFTAKYTTVEDNSAVLGFGGGVHAAGVSIVRASTVSSNYAASAGGLFLSGNNNSSALIVDSTISGNIARVQSGLWLKTATAHVYNSTISLNYCSFFSTESAALSNLSSGNASLVLLSSMVAGNTAGANHDPADLFVDPSSTVSGSDNLVIASNLVSPPPGLITVSSDPKLGQLQMNGGPTATHALLPGSPAIGTGNTQGLTPPLDSYDQRGAGYPRTTGPNASVDIGAFQFDSIFASGFEW